jgi:predicted metal-dependent enzyme (double-stranded beta helix superfamily)
MYGSFVMQTSPTVQSLPAANVATAVGVHAQSESLLELEVPGLAESIRQACLGEADLVPYRVRQALNQALDRASTDRLVKTIMSMPYSTQTYTRHMLYADPAGMFTVVALRWDPTQGSPVHAHYTWCAYRVLSGVLSESHFEYDRSVEQAYLFNRVTRAAGESVCGHGGMDFIHRLHNEGDKTVVSIHVYGIDAARMSTHVNRMMAVSLRAETPSQAPGK